MKSLFIASAFAAVYADNAKMFEQIDALLANASQFDRTISHADAGQLDHFGCWCYFEEDHKSGKGKPVNTLDHQCKILHDGYQCAIMDASSIGEVCVPWAVTYQSADGLGIGGPSDIPMLQTECLAQNPSDSCGEWACNIEGYFVMEIFNYFVNGGLIDTAMMHSNGFDIDVECPTNIGVASERECCGSQPTRFPYKTYGDRQCCIDRTFDSSIYTCCPDGTVSITC